MLHGDVPEEHKKLAIELKKQEQEIEELVEFLPAYIAQMYVCLAHDWFEIGVEEEGGRLIEKAEKTCPGYFKKEIQDHMTENPMFSTLVRRLFSMLIYNLIPNLEKK